MTILKLFGFGIAMLFGSTAIACMLYPLAKELDSWFAMIQIPTICVGVVAAAGIAKSIFDSIK